MLILRFSMARGGAPRRENFGVLSVAETLSAAKSLAYGTQGSGHGQGHQAYVDSEASLVLRRSCAPVRIRSPVRRSGRLHCW